MTIIKPQASDIIIRIMLFVLIVCLAVASILLVWFYNRAVNIQHLSSDAAAEIKKLETLDAELQDKTFTIFTNARVEAFAKEHGLVKEITPRYIEVRSQPSWSLASHY